MKRVTIVGVGALGSHVVPLLRSDELSLKIVDFDRVEQKNALSQFYGRPSVGKSKVQALSQIMQLLWGVKVESIPQKLTILNDQQLLGGADLVIECLDNAEARRIVQHYVRRAEVPCLHGALAAGGEFGRVVWDEGFRIDDESSAGPATCEDGDQLPFIAIVSAHLAQAAWRFLKSGQRIGLSIHGGGAIPI